MAITICAWCLIALSAIGCFGGPFIIDKPRAPFRAGDYVMFLIRATITTVVCGRILGWW